MKEINVSKEAKIIVQMIMQINKPMLTILQAIPLLKGNRVVLNESIKRVTDNFKGKMSEFNAHQIKRIIIKMLILRILNEKFIKVSLIYLLNCFRINTE